MRIVVTGGTGFVGRHLVGALAGEHELVCVARDPDALPDLGGVARVRGDLSDPAFAAGLPDRADAVVHLAQANVAFPDAADELFAVNAASTQRLASYARRAGASRFVFASSGSVYVPAAAPRSETDPVRPPNFYATTKCVSEDVLACYRGELGVCALRLFAPYGPGQTNRMIPRIMGAVREGRPVTLVNGGQPRVNPVFVADVVEVIRRALSLDGHHVVNVAGPRVVSVRDIAETAGEIYGREPVFDHAEAETVWNLVADAGRLSELFPGAATTDPSVGLRRAADAA